MAKDKGGAGAPSPVMALPGPNGTLCNTGSTTIVADLSSSIKGVTFLPCARPGGGGPPPPTPLQAATAAWYHEVVLPDPTLTTSPARALTGLDTFLSIGGRPSVTWSGVALGQAVRLDVSSTYDVDWGDPRPDGSTANGRARISGTTSQGGPYPDGDLRHQYIERGRATITVTQRWTAHWSAGGESGTLADRLVTSSSMVLPIDELQAVVTG